MKKIISIILILMVSIATFTVFAEEGGGGKSKSQCVCLNLPGSNTGTCVLIQNDPLRTGAKCGPSNGSLLDCYATQCTGSTPPPNQQ